MYKSLETKLVNWLIVTEKRKLVILILLLLFEMHIIVLESLCYIKEVCNFNDY